MALYDRTIFIQAPPELVWTEVRQAAGTRQVVIEQPGRLLLVSGAFSRGIAYALDRLPDGSTRLRRMVDNLAVLQRALTSGASPQVALAALGARPDRTNPFDTLTGNRALNRIRASARQAASAAGWAPRPLAPGEAPAAEEAAPRPAPPPWNPGDFFWLAVLFSFAATGILIALNWRRLGQPRRAWIALGVTALAALGCVVFIWAFSQNILLFSQNTDTSFVGVLLVYLFNLGLAYGLTAWQNHSPVYEAWIAVHGNPTYRQSGCLIPILVSLGATLLISVIAFGLVNMPMANTRFPSLNHFNQGVTFQNQGSLEAALDEYTQAIALDPFMDNAYNNRCSIYIQQDKYDLALVDCSRAIEINPTSSMALTNRGTIYYLQDNYPQALADLDKVIALDPKHGNAYFVRGMVHSIGGETDQAIADLEKALTLNLTDKAKKTAQEALGQLKP